MSLLSHEIVSFKGYRLNEKPLIFAKINPLVIFPFVSLFVFTWTPLWVFLIVFIGIICIFDLVDIKASEAIRGLNMRFIRRTRVVSCSTSNEIRIRNLQRMGLL